MDEEITGNYKNMTYYALVRKYFPEASDETCDFLLWSKTAFPLCSPEMVEQQLKELVENEVKNEP